MTTESVQDQLRGAARRLLEQKTVDVVIAWGQAAPGADAYPVFITRPEDARKIVWNNRCFPNLVAYLTRAAVKGLGKAAVVVKGCDERALVVLEQESQVNRENLYVIGVACDGVGEPRAAKCAICRTHQPRFADETLGQAGPESPVPDKDPELAAFLQKSPAERLAYWKQELARCVKCYACREVCPLCYCNRCIADKNRPTSIDTSPTLKGNFAWQINRAFHEAGRCVGCDECTRACPAGINLRLLNLVLAEAAAEFFDYRAGMDREQPPIIGSYSLQDKESFIK